MWWIDSALDMFSGTIPAGNYGLFRSLFGAAVLIKVGRELGGRHQDYFEPRGFLRFLYASRPRRFAIPEWAYRATFPVKAIAGVMLMTGCSVRLAAVALVLALLVEVSIYFRFHVNLYLLVSLIFALFPPLACSLAPAWTNVGPALLGDTGDPSVCSPIGPAAIVVTTCAMYWCTALRKLNRPFLEGLVVYHHLESVLRDRARRHHRDGWYPRVLVDVILHDRTTALRVISPLMWLTILLELSLPVLLSTPSTYWVGVVLGAAMHAGFTCMFPVVLLSFSVTTIAIYLLFADPWTMTFWMG